MFRSLCSATESDRIPGLCGSLAIRLAAQTPTAKSMEIGGLLAARPTRGVFQVDGWGN